MIVAAMVGGIIFILLVAVCLHKRNFQLPTPAADTGARGGAVSEVRAAAGAAGEAQTQILYTSSVQKKNRGRIEIVVAMPSNVIGKIIRNNQKITSGERVIHHQHRGLLYG